MPLLDKTALLPSHEETQRDMAQRQHQRRSCWQTTPWGTASPALSGLDPLVTAQPSACLRSTGPFRETAGKVTKAGEKGFHSSHIIVLALEKEEAGVWF